MSRFAIVVILACVSYASAETLESVEKTLIEKYDKYKSLSATMKMTMQMMPGMGGEGTGTMEFMRDDGKEKVRTEMTMKMESHMVSIFDGTDAYTITEMRGQKQAMKTPVSEAQGRTGGKEFFADLHRENELKLLPDETIDGGKAYVIEAKPKKAIAQGPTQMKYYFDQDNGVMVKMLGLDSGGKAVISMTMSDVKINPKLDPSRFVFKAPPGVKVVDMSKM